MSKESVYSGGYSAKLTSFYPDDEALMNFPCEVHFADGQLRLRYETDGDGTQNYLGTEAGSGHWELHGTLYKGKGTLHQFQPDARILEGSWQEGDQYGMWKIVLPPAGDRTRR